MGASAAEAETGWSGWEQWLRGHLDIERDKMLRGFAERMSQYVHEKLASRDAKIAKLEAQVETLLTLLAVPKSAAKSADVVELKRVNEQRPPPPLFDRAHPLAAAAGARTRLSQEQQRELAELRAEVSELREVLLLLVGISREQAEMAVATLRRQLMAILVRLERRDPS